MNPQADSVLLVCLPPQLGHLTPWAWQLFPVGKGYCNSFCLVWLIKPHPITFFFAEFSLPWALHLYRKNFGGQNTEIHQEKANFVIRSRYISLSCLNLLYYCHSSWTSEWHSTPVVHLEHSPRHFILKNLEREQNSRMVYLWKKQTHIWYIKTWYYI